MAIRLIVNADDYGRTPGVSAGIREAHRRGIVTSTTAVMNMPGVDEALRQALRDCPRLGLGVHLILTAGRPLLSAGQVRSLTGDSGAFLRQHDLALALPTLEANEVAAEWRAQVERFVATTERAPDHLDSHHHVSYWTPPLLRAMLALAQEYHCAIRLPTGEDAEQVGGDLPAGAVQPLARWSGPLLEEFQPRHPDHLDTSFYGPSATPAHLLDLLAHLPAGTTELMCHPGYADAGLLRGSSYNRQRESELAVLTSPDVIAPVRERGIELIRFGQLPAGRL
jgi:predicted glycoside hydrolase/deacetylase ChbG (UPF0249 family)